MKGVVTTLEPNGGEYVDVEFADIILTKTEIKDIEFDNCSFLDCDFNGSSFTGVTFSDCTFTNCNLGVTKYNDSQMKDCKFESCRLMGIDWRSLVSAFGMVLDCKNCDLSYSAFDNMNIQRSTFENCKFNEAVFDTANLQKCIFANCDFTRATFTKCDLKDADLSSAFSYYIDISSNSCRKAKFSYPEVLSLLTGAGIIVEENPGT
jgi:uncharacterized protein YjbI with pentapeptide repeats